MNLEFAQPQWLAVGAAALVSMLALFVWAERKRRQAIVKLAAASPDSSVASALRWARQGLALLGVVFVCAALARPMAGHEWVKTPHRGVDLMFAVDTSKSMRASDLRPDRLTRAKLAVADLVRKVDGERVGLIAFAGDAFVQAPMTMDRGVFLEALDALDTDVIPRGGTDLASAIRAGVQAMGSEPDHRKVMVLLSDGEDLEGSALDAARDAAKQGLTLYTVGVGSAQGELITTGDGEVIRSRLDEPMLKSIAQATGGEYKALGADGRGLDAVFAVAQEKLPSKTADGDAHKVMTERFQVPLALAMACLALELLIGERRRRRHATAGVAMGLALFALPGTSRADAVTSYNDGTALYGKRDFVQAQKSFESSLRTGDVGLQGDAYYDLGNARYRSGQATLEKDRDGTIAQWKQSLAAYDAALALVPQDGDAKFNRDLVAKKLAALEEQKKEDEKKNQAQKNQKGQGQQPKDQQAQKDQNGQGQQPKDQQAQKDQNGQGQQPKDQQAQKDQNGQGQQPKDQQAQKDQAGQGQQPKDQQAQKDQAGQGQQPKDQQAQKDQNGQGQQPKDQQAQKDQNGQQPKPGDASPKNDAQASAEPQKPADAAEAPDAAQKAEHDRSTAGRAEAAAQQQRLAEKEAAADAARRAAGALTRDEAMQLLDSVDRELKPLPIHGKKLARADSHRIKDW